LHSANVVIPGVLKSFDLPDVAASIAGRPLQIIDPVDAMKQPVDIAVARGVYRRAAEAYARKSAGDRFQILRTSC
ncbi:MAG: hypothetical protein ACRD8O_10105, partial [Bryobacteraceae bacterium]